MGKILNGFARDAGAVLDDSLREVVEVHDSFVNDGVAEMDNDFAKAEVVEVEVETHDDFAMGVRKAAEVQ